MILMLYLTTKRFKNVWYEDLKPFFIEFLKKAWAFIKDWRNFISFGLAWCITNGWCYIFIILGEILNVLWMRRLGWGYLAFLWMPFTAEKVVTIPIAVFIKKKFFKKHCKLENNNI